MALPGARHQDSFKVRMAVKRDAKHVPDFALVPISGGPEIRYSWQRRMVAIQRNLKANVFVALVREQVIDDREITWRLISARVAHTLVDGREVIKRAIGLRDISL